MQCRGVRFAFGWIEKQRCGLVAAALVAVGVRLGWKAIVTQYLHLWHVPARHWGVAGATATATGQGQGASEQGNGVAEIHGLFRFYWFDSE